LGVGRRGAYRCLRFEEGERCLTFTPGEGWALLFSLENAPVWGRHILDALWMFLLLLPLGLVVRDQREPVLSALGATLLLGLAVALTRLIWPPPTQLVAAVMGLAVGYGVRSYRESVNSSRM
jgi:hypothetical protein